MDIHEYQAKQILADRGVVVPAGGLAYSPDQAAYQANTLGGERWVVKAQVHTGGRGKVGGVRFCSNEQEVWDAADSLLGSKLVTTQTGPRGRGVYRLYVEEATALVNEYYLAFLLERSAERIVCIASSAGGMDIEQIAEETPELLHREVVEPAVGLQAFQARRLAFAIGLEAPLLSPWAAILNSCYRAFRDLDATLLEINPLAVTDQGRLVALDAKMSFDDNATFRHPTISEYRDKSQEDPRERDAIDRGLSYVGLDGNIGCIINGAGLAMATMDMIKFCGGEPANFLDIGGGASPERVTKAFNLVLSDANVETLLVNIFAGINRCDWVAEGVVAAMTTLDVRVPVVVRLSGTHATEGRRILEESGLDLITVDTLADAGEEAVRAANTRVSS